MQQSHFGVYFQENVKQDLDEVTAHPVFLKPYSYSREVETTQMSVGWWVNKESGIQIQEYYAALKGKEILSCATTWMNLKAIMLSEISQLQKDKYCMILLISSICGQRVLPHIPVNNVTHHSSSTRIKPSAIAAPHPHLPSASFQCVLRGGNSGWSKTGSILSFGYLALDN